MKLLQLALSDRKRIWHPLNKGLSKRQVLEILKGMKLNPTN